MFNLREWAGYREYEDLRREYEDLRYVHNLDYNHKNIFTSKKRNTGTLHPTEKPTDILSRLIKTHSRVGNTVLDPFCGSFSTIISCLHTKRHFIGFELSPEYYSLGNERIKGYLKVNGKESVEECYK